MAKPANLKLQQDYRIDVPVLHPFRAHPAGNLDPRPLLAARTEFSTLHRRRLVEVLSAQHQLLAGAHKVREHIDLLKKETTFTVCCGQQPAWLGGPMYNLYKALSTVFYCRCFKQQAPAYDFVPVFWMATEDHDIQELNHTWLGWEEHSVYPHPITGAIGRHELVSAPELPEELTFLTSYWGAGTTWTEAFRQTLHHWLAQYGVLFLNPDTPRLKELFAPIMQRELTEQFVYPPVVETGERLSHLGYPYALSGRPINLFYLTTNQRLRIEYDSGRKIWFTPDAPLEWSRSEILTELETHPERFSPNAALRPVFQETVLPNLVYIGGWGEIAYWLQLKPVFDALGLSYPQVSPRASALLVPETVRNTFQNYRLPLELLEQSDALLRERLVRQLHNFQPFDMSQDQILKKIRGLQTLLATQNSLQARTIGALGSYAEKKMNHSRKQQYKEILQRHPLAQRAVFKARNLVQPEGRVQERTLNLHAFWPSSSPAVLERLLQKMPFDSLLFTLEP
jgi:uncharacterized protein YllA (UPF0747 family)